MANPSNRILVSAASAWEITTKARLGKLPGAADVAADVAACVASQGFPHIEDVALVSHDQAFDEFDVRRLW